MLQQQTDAYLVQAYKEGQNFQILLRYTACTGLINQHYSHISAVMLSAMLGAELVLPPAVKRDSFANYFSPFQDKNEIIWSPTPLESLYNVDQIVDFWQKRGLFLHKVCHQGILFVLRQLMSSLSVFPVIICKHAQLEVVCSLQVACLLVSHCVVKLSWPEHQQTLYCSAN